MLSNFTFNESLVFLSGGFTFLLMQNAQFSRRLRFHLQVREREAEGLMKEPQKKSWLVSAGGVQAKERKTMAQ